MNLVLVIPSLEMGGAERIMSTMVNYWSDNGFDITLLTLSLPESDFYTISPKVKRISLNLLAPSQGICSKLVSNTKRFLKIRKQIKHIKPDAVISFMDVMNVTVLISMLGLRIPIIISERADPRHTDSQYFWIKLRNIFYTKADALVVQTHEVACWASSRWSKLMIITIPNPILSRKPESKVSLPEGSWVMALGRLHHVKGFDMLIKAFAKIAKEKPRWNLLIVGEGEERESLEEIVREYGLEGRVLMPGASSCPENYMSEIDIYALSSRSEGFPNAMLEAMAFSLPVVSFDCPSGPRAIIKNNSNGLLVPENNIDNFANALLDLMNSESYREEIGLNAKNVIKTYDINNVMEVWESLAKELSYKCDKKKLKYKHS